MPKVRPPEAIGELFGIGKRASLSIKAVSVPESVGRDHERVAFPLPRGVSLLSVQTTIVDLRLNAGGRSGRHQGDTKGRDKRRDLDQTFHRPPFALSGSVLFFSGSVLF